MHRFQRAPNRTEKEPMRQIYMYYKRLKQYLQKLGVTGGPAASLTNAKNVRSNSTGAGSGYQSSDAVLSVGTNSRGASN